MYKSNNIRTLLALTFFCLFSFASAQSPQLYTPLQGLTSSHVNSLYQDPLGLIWISGEKGLSSFDGLNFQSYKYSKDKEFSLRSNITHNILVDKLGQYWVGTSKGLHKFDKEKNKFEYLPVNTRERQSGDAVYISDIIESFNKDQILVSTNGYGVYIINIKDQSIDSVQTKVVRNIMPSGFVKTIFIDSKNRLWVSMEINEFCAIDLNSFERINLVFEKGLENYIINSNVNVFTEDSRTGNILIGDQNLGLLIYDKHNNIIRRPRNSFDQYFNTIESILERKDGKLLIGSENQGLWEFDRKTETIKRFYIEGHILNMRHSKVHSMIEDMQGNLWLGIYQQGVLKIPQNNSYVEYLPVSIDGEYGNAAANTSFFRDNQGNLWIGTDGAGLFCVNRRNNTIKNYNTSNTGLLSNSIMSIAKDGQDNIWIATYGYGLFYYKNGVINNYQSTKILEQKKIMSLLYDQKRNYLYISTHGNGLYYLDLNKNELTHVKRPVNRWINTLFLDNSNLLWIGSTSKVSCYDPDKDEIKEYNLKLLSNINITSFAEYNHSIWIGTNDGIAEYNRDADTCTLFETDNDITGVSAIITDKKNGLWATVNNGIFYMDLKTKQNHMVSSYEVSQAGEFCSGAAYSYSDSLLIFGGNNGVIIFNSKIGASYQSKLPPIVFSKLHVNEFHVDYQPEREEKNRLDAAISNATQIKLDGKNNSFSIDFAVLDYTNPHSINYTYKLVGYDTQWRTSKSQTATYENLPYGKYKLIVKANYRNTGDLQIEEETRSIDIIVAYPWYLTIYAKFTYFILVLILGFIIYRIYYNKYQQNKLLDQTKEKERIKEAKLKLFTSISHEIRTPLTLIISPLKKLMEKNEKDEDAKSIYNLMYRNSMRILMLINQLIDIRKIDNGQLKLHFDELDLLEEIKATMLSFNNMAIVKQIRFSLENFDSDYLKIWADKLHFDKIFFNLFSNAFKYTPEEGKILIRIRCHENKKEFITKISEFVEITVFNSGSNISEKDIDNIFERFYQGDNNQNGGSGIGLNLTKELVELHHGKIDIRNVADSEGVEFKILLPLGNAHLSEEELEITTEHQNTNSDDTTHKDYLKMLSANILPDNDDDDKTDKRKLNILVVDDDDDFLKYIKGELSEYNVSISKSGNMAYKQILVNMPDIVVTDLMMPDGDGYDLCNRIKNNPDTDHIPVIILTSENDESNRVKSLQFNADQYLSKPLNIQLLKSAISQVVRIREKIKNKMQRTEMGYNYNQIKIDSADAKLTKKVVDIITENLKEPDFGVEELSREVGMSRVHLNRKLKENFGMSPSTLIRSIRLKQAAYLLIHNKVNVSEVAYMVGFSSHSYFSNNFSNYFGMSPKEFIAYYSENADDETIKKLFE